MLGIMYWELHFTRLQFSIIFYLIVSNLQRQCLHVLSFFALHENTQISLLESRVGPLYKSSLF